MFSMVPGLTLLSPAVQADKIDEAQVDGAQSAVCPIQGSTSLCIQLDQSFTIVNFGATPPQCSGPADPNDPCSRNDDDFSVAIPLQFNFNLYGQPWNTIYINNNGNISFGQSFCTFTPSGFPIADFPMVAPFWADVDTRPAGSGVTYYKSEANRFTVTWDNVGYFGNHDDKLNTFQLIISDGTDPEMGLGNNVCFCYGNMDWTTGDASGGQGGFGGTPATVGVNKGDGTNYFLIGRFDHPGNDYDGPGGNPDGVDYLDGRHFCFNASGETNQAPIAVNFPNGNLWKVRAGETFQLQVGFISPEQGQITTVVVNAFGLQNFTAIPTPGNPALVNMTFSPTVQQVGDHTVRFTATDNGTPPLSTVVDLLIRVNDLPVPVEPSTWGGIKARYED